MTNFMARPDAKILMAGFLIMILSFLNLLFISDEAFFSSYAFKQFLWMTVAVVIFFVISKLRLQTIKKVSGPFYLISIFMLAFVLIVGEEISGAKSWIKIGGFMSFQPSELVKISLIFIIAKFYSDLGAYSKSY